MKNLLFPILIVFFAIHTSNAQNKSFNLNGAPGIINNEMVISTSKSTSSFQNAKRVRELQINPVVQKQELVNVKDTILLDLFVDKKYKACVENVSVDVNGTLLIRAKLLGYDYAYFASSTFDGKSSVTIEIPELDELYITRYDQQTKKYYLLQIAKSKQKIIEGGPSLIPPANNNLKKSSKKKLPEDAIELNPGKNATIKSVNIANDQSTRDTITLMIIYTPAAAAWSGSNETHINNTIGLLMAKAQLALDNSKTFIRLKLVHTEQVSYNELNNSSDLDNLTGTSDGFMDNVHSLRDTYCADVVVLLEDIDFTGGLAWILNSTSGNPDYAFSLSRVQQASSTYTTIHEIGHNMGCGHHKAQTPSPGPGLYSYSAGWRWTGTNNITYCSVMTYEGANNFADGISATQVPYFSNPDIQYHGMPVGDAVDADNARTLRQVKSIVAAYRVGCYCTPPGTQATGFTASALGDNSMTIGWTRGNGNAVLVVARSGSAVNSEPVSGETYTADVAFGRGTQIGIENYVVYNGSENSVNISGLTSGTIYYYDIYEYASASNCYLIPALNGNATTTGTPPYCAAGSPGTNYEYISNVKIGSVNQESERGTAGYQDYTSQITSMQIGINTSATISVTNSFSTDQIIIWVDWNKDGDFADEGENVYSSIGEFTSPHSTTNFAPPVGAAIGKTRMRIRLHDAGAGPNSTPCGDADYGEVEDYTVNVVNNSQSTIEIFLNTGWNIISANVVPTNLDMKAIFQALIDAGTLKKVMDETGKTIENFGAFGGWKNNIGNLATSEGYKVNVLAAATLSLEGTPVQLPLDIALNTGWNIISYPSATTQDAKALVQSLIDAGKLKKVMDESGKTIENFGAFGGWKNNIGNFMPGKGYKVNVNESCILTIPADGTKSAIVVPELMASEHFKPVFIGNGTDHMNIHLVNLQASGLVAGDEIGIFDGQLSVGSATIGVEQLMAGSISIPASANDELEETENGFTSGHLIEIQLYRESQTYHLKKTKLSGNESFEKNGSLFTQVRLNDLTAVQITDNSAQFKCYPNPFTQEITIEVQNPKQTKITVEIYNMAGQRIKNLFSGDNDGKLALKWNGTNDSGQQVASGVYLCKVNGQTKQIIYEGGQGNK